MRLLDYIKGKDGERLASACLAYLLDRSPEMRHAFLAIATEACNLRPPSVSGRFELTVEFGTRQAQEGNDTAGFLDLLIRTDKAVIGIEIKIFAGFQAGQPEKYRDAIAIEAQRLPKYDEKPVQDSLIVLAPKYREREIRRHLQQSAAKAGSPVAFVAWEEVLDAFARIRTLDAAAALARDELDDFLRRQIEFFHGFPGKLYRLKAPVEDSANETQADFLQRLWTEFRPDSLYETRSFRPKPARNVTYGGYFLKGTSDLGWYGFQNAATLGDTSKPDRALFLIGLNGPIRDALAGASRHDIQEVPATRERRGWGDLWRVWTMEPIGEMGTMDFWTELLKPVHAAVRKLVVEERSVVGFVSRSEDP